MRNESFRLAKRPFRFRWVFRFVSGPKRNDAAVFDGWRRCERASDLNPCPQKLRKGALKPLKQLVRVNLCAPWEVSSTVEERWNLRSRLRFDFVESDYPALSGREVRYLLTTSSI